MKIEALLTILIWSVTQQCALAQDLVDFEKFIRENPEKSSFHFIKNDSISFGVNEDKLNPVASLSKTIIAIEFAYQVINNNLEADELVSIDDIDLFAVGDDNYKNWSKQIKKDKLVKNGQVPVKYVVQGMIRFSANACADFLLNRLGIDNVNERIKNLSITHEPIFPFTASLLVAFNYEQQDKEVFLQKAHDWSREEFRANVVSVHQKILEDKNFLSQIKKRLSPSIYNDPEYDSLWTSLFSLSTAKEYAILIGKINQNEFDPLINDILKFIFESWAIKDNVALQQTYSGIAYKGANSNSLINVWMYLRNNDGTTTEFVGLFNHLTKDDYKVIESGISNFGFKLSTDQNFMEQWMNK